MRPEYILLILLFILPLIYKLGYWGSIFASQGYSIRTFFHFIKTRKGIDTLLHFWIVLELALFVLSLIPLYNPPFEIFLFNVMLYFLWLYNIFIIGKLLRKKFIFPKLDIIIIATAILVLLDGIWSIFLSPLYIYSYLSWALLMFPLYFICALVLRNIYVISRKSFYK